MPQELVPFSCQSRNGPRAVVGTASFPCSAAEGAGGEVGQAGEQGLQTWGWPTGEALCGWAEAGRLQLQQLPPPTLQESLLPPFLPFPPRVPFWHVP